MSGQHFKKMAETFAGSAHDHRDGFIHMSRGEQLDRVITKYYSKTPMYIVGFNLKDFGEDLIWENGYPHIYNSPLQLKMVKGSSFMLQRIFKSLNA